MAKIRAGAGDHDGGGRMTYTLYQGDCLDILQTLEAGSVDLAVTSPPYDNLRNYGDGFNSNSFDWHEIIRQLYTVTKLGGVVVWVVGDETINGSETGTSFKQALWAMECGFNLHDTMIYRKPHLAFPDTNRYYQCFEYMFIWSKGQPKTFNPIKDRNNTSAGRRVTGMDRRRDGGFKERSGLGNIIQSLSVRFNDWEISNQFRTVTDTHPAIFPEALARDHIISWSNIGDVVFDPMMGSGTTGKAALQTGRNFIGIELDPDYFRIAEQRIKNAAGDFVVTDKEKANGKMSLFDWAGSQ